MRELSELGIYYQNCVIERPVPSLDEIAEFQARHGVTLPEDYVKFLRTVNGGAPTLNFFESDDAEFAIEAFHYLALQSDANDCYSIAVASEWPSEELGRQVIAIAGDGSGDQLIIDPSLGPEVRLWRHDDGSQPEILAPRFEALLAGLKPDQQDDE
ncbi:SMI1/KNR4 family protein [Pseudomonas piscis]